MKLSSKILCTALAMFGLAGAASGQVVISQVYGGGGNSGATYTNDFIELFNRGTTPVNVTGWSVQYASSAGSSWSRTVLSGTIQPGQYYLVQEAMGAGGSLSLPTPDAVGTIAMSGTAGKVALADATITTTLTGSCPTTGIVDFVGYGTATNCSETTPTATLSNPTAAIRNSNGCTDTGNNSSDFSVGAPTPRNTSSSLNPCSGPNVPPSASGSTNPTSSCVGGSVTFTVTTVPGTPASPITSVTGDFLTIGLSSAEVFTQGPTNTWTYTINVPNVSVGNYTFPVIATDGMSRTANASVVLQVITCDPQITSGTGASPSGVCNGSDTTLTVNVLPGQNPTSASYTVTVDLGLIGGTIVPMTQTGPTTFQVVANVPMATVAGSKALPISVTDDQNRTDTGTITIYTDNCTPSASEVVISQVYGGGGNSGATLTNDFVEIFNRSGSPVNISGWSVQYASASNGGGGFASGNPATNAPVVLSGTLQPGQYYLIQMAAGAGGTTPLPTPDATGNVAMNSSEARVALVRNSTPQLLNCTGPDFVDLVGYGTSPSTGAVCFEGSSAASTLSNTTASFRQSNGCQDNDNNRLDFFSAAPAPRNTASPFNLCTISVATGACCVSGSCSITTNAACTGTYQGNNTVCSPNPCAVATGACCNGTSCSIQTSAFCGTVGGTYQGNGSSCSPNPCSAPTGVCCRGSTCNASISQAACTTSGTQWGAAFSTLSNTCGTGTTTPCCYADYDKTGGIATGDIFAFLNDWFASSTFADVGGDGTATPDTNDIFSFLNAWFSGGC